MQAVAISFPDISEAKAALKLMDDFINEIVSAYEVNQQNIFLLGFSQGFNVSTAYALNHPHKDSACSCLSGYVNEGS